MSRCVVIATFKLVVQSRVGWGGTVRAATKPEKNLTTGISRHHAAPDTHEGPARCPPQVSRQNQKSHTCTTRYHRNVLSNKTNMRTQPGVEFVIRLCGKRWWCLSVEGVGGMHEEGHAFIVYGHHQRPELLVAVGAVVVE